MVVATALDCAAFDDRKEERVVSVLGTAVQRLPLMEVIEDILKIIDAQRLMRSVKQRESNRRRLGHQLSFEKHKHVLMKIFKPQKYTEQHRTKSPGNA